MGKKAVKQDLILKGIDPKTAILGPDGLFMAPLEAANPMEVAIEHENNQTPKNALIMPVESAKTEKPKAPKTKKAKEPKAEESVQETKPEVE